VFLLGNHDWLSLRLLLLAPILLLLLVAASAIAVFVLLLAATGISWLVSRLVFLRWRAPALVRLIGQLSLFPSADGRDFLERLLVNRLMAVDARWGTAEPPAPFVRFLDLALLNQPPLRVIATDIDSGTMAVFDDVRTPFASVADAVIASMSIPLLFPPARVRDSTRSDGEGPRHVDGGLVSNLPVWALASDRRQVERATGARVPIIAFAITTPAAAAAPKRLWIWPYIKKVLRTGIFGSQAEGLARAPGVIVVPLETAIGLTRFDLDRDTARSEIDKAEARALALLRWRLIDRPQRAATALGELCAKVQARAGAGRIRATLYRLTEDEEFAVVEAFGRDGDPDRLLGLDAASPLMRALVETRAPTSFSVVGRSARELMMRPDEHRLLPDWLHGQLALPIFADAGSPNAPIVGALLLESDRELESVLDDHRLMEELAAGARDQRETLSNFPPEHAKE
jgi:predicted acylesterase/phospholipase RssA